MATQRVSVGRRLWLWVPAALIVGVGLAYAAVVLYFYSKPPEPHVAGSPYGPSPQIGMFILEYWYGWVAIAAGWIGFGYLAYHVLRRGLSAAGSRPFSIVIRTELASIIGALSSYAVLHHISTRN